ncbi:MAG TPA: hypothetical protein VIP46_18115 [Pyrinomonadaceae bacterium]
MKFTSPDLVRATGVRAAKLALLALFVGYLVAPIPLSAQGNAKPAAAR